MRPVVLPALRVKHWADDQSERCSISMRAISKSDLTWLLLMGITRLTSSAYLTMHVDGKCGFREEL